MSIHHQDIIIIGGGSAGIAAAVSAAQEGLNVTIIEKNSFFGGKATSAEVGTVCGLFKYSNTQDYLVHGFTREFANQLQILSNSQPISNHHGLHFLPYSIEAFKNLCLDLLSQYQIKILLNSNVIEVDEKNNQVESITIELENEKRTISCRSIIDCSGESIVSQLSELPIHSNDTYQAAAQVFTIDGLPEMNEMNLNLVMMRAIQKAIQSQLLDQHFERLYLVLGSYHHHQASFKLGIPLEVDHSANNLLMLRETAVKMIHELIAYLKNNIETFKDISLQHIAPEVGTRVGIRSQGRYTLTLDDVIEAKKFDHAIANCSWPIEEWGQDRKVKLRFFQLDDYYQIPAECLQSDKISNLFFGGRNISATNEAIASARVMGICLQTGYAAGKLAANCIQKQDEINVIRSIQLNQLLY